MPVDKLKQDNPNKPLTLIS